MYGKFPTHLINSEGFEGLYSRHHFAFGSGIVVLGSIQRLTVEESRILLFSFALE